MLLKKTQKKPHLSLKFLAEASKKKNKKKNPLAEMTMTIPKAPGTLTTEPQSIKDPTHYASVGYQVLFCVQSTILTKHTEKQKKDVTTSLVPVMHLEGTVFFCALFSDKFSFMQTFQTGCSHAGGV